MEKQYLYHRVPIDENGEEKMKGATLHPLYELKDKFPELYQSVIEKYKDREWVPDQPVPSIDNCKWGDVLQFTAVHPKDLKQALIDAGFEPKEMKFYQIDPNLLDPSKTTVYLYNTTDNDEVSSTENFSEYDPNNLTDYSIVTDTAKKYYKERQEQGKCPLLFVGIPHIFHKGSLDTSNLPVITV